ncbi:CMC2 [Auxenochlorella protothecoides x Auxenochlorella symbiontica]|uniref:COX assembly mitochondrial protein n=1 Tax=Auxenochlorella protothecoides TaxID=3075 RepID=A0A087SH85_AUXPR|nr:COX assembly mitochondrial protein 2 [Auxenochlorella protothecoides]KFM25089.1 COX assembly mitochondrial protein 2 [Auxenochlorella protothecoides]
MHPPLYKNKHPSCIEVIDALNRCHKERSIAKFWGVCTDQKLALDACFRQEKKDNRARNFEKARAERERLEVKIGTGAATPGYGVRSQHAET